MSEKLKTIVRDPPFSYFGRFQLGLMVKTKYVAFLDDDSIPGSRYFEICLRALSLPAFQGSIMGMKGVTATNVPPPNPFDINRGPMGPRDHIVEIDCIGGVWVSDAQLVKLLWYNHILTDQSAEDYQWCYGVRTHAGGSCFTMPALNIEAQFLGYSPDYLAISSSGDTTLSQPGKWEARMMVERVLYERGLQRVRDPEVWKKGPGILFFAFSATSRKAISSLILDTKKTFIQKKKKKIRIMCAIDGRDAHTDSISKKRAQEMGCHVNPTEWWNLRVGMDFPIAGSSLKSFSVMHNRNLASRLFYNVLLSANPKIVVAACAQIGAKEEDIALLGGAVLSARDLNVPFLCYQELGEAESSLHWEQNLIATMSQEIESSEGLMDFFEG